ncbi:Pvc16 family protein [Caldilinea sp.]|uniref:Pvc16 family protein n=1 Tax=Caldilinea sp. TaxID=2293560 RepID=UPI002CFA62FB|nr:Pvc16 family protein [Caldilinea sp.]
MSNHLAIATVTTGLVRYLQGVVGADVGNAVITAVRPDGPNSGVPEVGVNVFLYQATPNIAWRNHDLPTRRPDGSLNQRPQIALDLHYLLTFYGDETLLEPQRILGSAVRALHTHPLLTRQEIRSAVAATAFLAGSDLAEEVETVKFTPQPLSLEELSKLWSVLFQTPYTLSMTYDASVVLITAESQPSMAQPVRTPAIQVFPSVTPPAPAAPDTLAGLQLWLRGDADITYDSAAAVSAWRDQSGAGHHAVQPDAARRPQLVRGAVGGKPAVRFDGVDDYLAIEQLSYAAAGAIGGLTLFALLRTTAVQAQTLASFDRSAYWELGLTGGGSPGCARWSTQPQAGAAHDLDSPGALADGRWRLLCVRFAVGATATKQLFIDGILVATADAHPGEALGSGVTRFGFVGAPSQAAIFNGPAGAELFRGDLAELALYDRALTDDERDHVEQYFAEKYG